MLRSGSGYRQASWRRLKQALASYGAIAEEPESVPWEEVYPDFNGSVALRGARKREALTQKN